MVNTVDECCASWEVQIRPTLFGLASGCQTKKYETGFGRSTLGRLSAGFQVTRNGALRWISTRDRVTAIVRFEDYVKKELPSSAEQQALAERMKPSVKSFDKAMIGSVPLKVSRWFLAMPSFLDEGEKAAAAMWFGQVEKIFTHIGPGKMSNLILQVSIISHFNGKMWRASI